MGAHPGALTEKSVQRMLRRVPVGQLGKTQLERDLLLAQRRQRECNRRIGSLYGDIVDDLPRFCQEEEGSLLGDHLGSVLLEASEELQQAVVESKAADREVAELTNLAADLAITARRPIAGLPLLKSGGDGKLEFASYGGDWS